MSRRPLAWSHPAPFIYVADSENNVVRRLDTRTGRELLAAGTGSTGFSGDGGPATSAQLNGPSGVAVDAAGDLFIADAGNGRIRKVDTTGTITTVAGGGSPADGLGDGGPATSAQLNYPSGVAVDLAGNLFIADTHNERIRKVDTAGTITTVAGSGPPYQCGFGGCRGGGFSGDGGPATSAQLNAPLGVAVDAEGDLFIADAGNNRIRKVDTTGTITTVAGSGECDPVNGCTAGFSGDGGSAASAQLNGPSGVAVDSAGNLSIADTGNQRIRMVDITGTINTVAGNGTSGFGGDGGPATSASLNAPAGVAVDAAGYLFIADTNNGRIREVDTRGTITTVAGITRPAQCNPWGCPIFSGDGGPATSAQLNYPVAVAVDAAGDLLITDSEHQRIRMVDTSGTIITVAGGGDCDPVNGCTAGFSGDGGPATSAQLADPEGVAVDAAGNLFIADTGNERIRKVDTAGIITTVAGNGACCDVLGDGGPATNAQLSARFGVAVDAAGNLFISDQSNNRIRKVDTAGTITTVAGGGNGGLGDGGPATSAHLGPLGVAVDPAGNLFIADFDNGRIRKVDTTGRITTVAGGGNGGLGDGGPATSAVFTNGPLAVAVDAAGNLFIADSYDERIRKVDTSGTITTVAGGGCCGPGDGGPATSAVLSFPRDVAVDAAGNLFIADSASNRVRKVEAIAATCLGDCNTDGQVTIDELIALVNIALSNGQGVCPHAVPSGTAVGIAFIIQAVNNALNGCMLTAEQGCLMSGGSVAVASCCASTGDFPDTCAIGACGCAPAGSHDVRVCHCDTGSCFNGSACVSG